MRRPSPITLASRAGWNRLVRWWFRRRLTQVRVLEPGPWRPPWHCRLRWDAEGQQWTVSVRPGWCESPTGDPSPTVATVARLAPTAAERLGLGEDPEAALEARLDEGPRMPIPQPLWRAAGTDALEVGEGAGERLPAEILRRGVLPPSGLRETETGLVRQVSGLVSARAEASLARVVELYLEHGREVASLEILGGAGAEVDLQPLFLPARPASPRLALRRDRLEEGEGARRWLRGGLSVIADEGVDRRHVATLWLTSPPGAPEGSVPDAGWRPYVVPRLDRNVAYEVEGPTLRLVEPLRLNVPGRDLAGGVAAGLIGSLAGDLESRADELDARLAGVRTSGRFVGV
jgi:hypothetical protein